MTTTLPPPSPLTPEQEKLAAQIAERQKLVSKGVNITLADGRTLDLRYGMAALVELEETFGSLEGVGSAFQSVAGGGGKVFTSVLGLLAAGLAHHGITRATLLRDDLLAVDRLQEYANAANEAFDRAFPTVEAGEGKGEAPGAA